MEIMEPTRENDLTDLEVEQLRKQIAELRDQLERERRKGSDFSVERLQMLHEIDYAILSSSTPEEIARVALDHLSRLIPFFRGSVSLFDFQKQIFSVLAIRTHGETQIGADTHGPITDFGTCFDTLQKGKIHFEDDLRCPVVPSNIGYILHAEGICSYVNVPLITQNELLGSLNLGANQTNGFLPQHIEVAQEVASQLAIAIRQAQLIRETQRKNMELRGLYETALATSGVHDLDELLHRLNNQIQQLFTPDTFMVALYDAARDDYQVVLVIEAGENVKVWQGEWFAVKEGGLTSWVIESRQTLLVRDIFRDPLPSAPKYGPRPSRSWLGVPLLSQNHLIGVISVQAFEPQAFDETHQRLLETLASQVAVAIENAQLFKGNQQSIERLTALRKIDIAITTNFNIQEVLTVLLEQVTDQLRVDAADIFLFDKQTQALIYSIGKGFTTAIHQPPRLKLGLGYAGQAALHKKLIVIPDINEASDKPGRFHHLTAEHFIAYYGVPLISKGQVVGVLEIFHRSPLNPDQDWLNYLEALAGQTAIAIDNTSLINQLESANNQLNQAYSSTLEGWAKALELRDMETQGHSRRVTEMTVRLAQKLCVPENEMIFLRYGALLHDIGKMGIPDSILRKTGELSEDEWEVMRKHPIYAYEMLSPIAFLQPALDIPYYHHEKWDGSGYPSGLKGEQIPLAARIFAVVDVWDAFRSTRPYRVAYPEEKVLEYLREQSGKHFDPRIVEAFLDLLRKNEL